ncbi:MAG: PmoA family protein [Planctomycetota bacterium]|nr:PmoA family protein [Planctomycetota bacterium]
MKEFLNSRRDFLKRSMYLGAASVAGKPIGKVFAQSSLKGVSGMKFGFVTYQWGKDWDLATLIANCEKAKLLGVELRTEHAHGVESNISAQQRRDVKKRFDDSPVKLVGLGTNFCFHHVDPAKLRQDIEGAKEYVKLCRDVGGSGVKVKPNDLPKEVSREKTIEQIGRSLNELGRFGAEYGQQIRLEVHGSCSPLPVIKQIMDIADHPNVGVCWNCNSDDLVGEGLKSNFNLVKGRFGDTVHVRELNISDYPYQELINLLAEMGYGGWVLLEARTSPQDRLKAMVEQHKVWEEMVAKAQSAAATVQKKEKSSGVKITELADKIRVEADGKLFTEYNFKDVPRPYFYPVIGPTGDCITRHWPMKEVENEDRDHIHHRSLWFAHGDVNGIDFWGEGNKSGKIVHDKFVQVVSGPEVGIIQSQNKWVAADGKVICTDTRTHKFYNRPDGQIMDFDVTIHASNGDVTLGDTKEGSMAIRLAATMQVEGKVGQGHIVNSEGQRDKETWGKRATWCDCYGPVNGQVVGVAIFDHPQNPKHPVWWHVRTYGLFAANPFGVHDFEGKPAGTGNIVIPAGQSLTFKYRFYFHKGDQIQGQVAERYREYTAAK